MKTREARIEDLAKESFKDHKLHVVQGEGEGRVWRCQRDGTWIYGFYVVASPGALIVYGDIGDQILLRSSDMIKWIRGAIGSKEYVIEKIPGGHDVKKQFNADFVRPWLDEYLEEVKRDYPDEPKRTEAVQKAIEEWGEAWSETEPRDAYEMLYDLDLDAESMDRFYEHRASIEWTYYALVKFCELLEAA